MTSNNIIKNILLIFVLSIFLLKQSVAQNAFSDTLAVKQEKVTIGYGSQHAWIVTSSVSHTKGSDLQKNFTPDL